MDIHKPKPWHGVREFLKEYVIIVVGVLTALGAEAVVEKQHEARLTAEAREAVRAEINTDLANMKRRDQMQPCIERRLAELRELVARAEAGQPVTPPLTVGIPGHPFTYVERWEAATASGRVSLFSADEQRGFARVYMEIKHWEAEGREEDEAWGSLLALEGVQHLSPDLLARARDALGHAQLVNRRTRLVLFETESNAGRIGITGDDPHLLNTTPYARQYICLPLSTTAADGAKLVSDHPL